MADPHVTTLLIGVLLGIAGSDLWRRAMGP